jgi:hypothetical protein
MNKNYPADISFFRLSLLEFLRESFPELLYDEKFINARTEVALDAYEQEVKNGGNPLESEHWANETLFEGLHFSKYETVKYILWNEFFNEVREENAATLALKLLPKCETVFAKYSLLDNFACEPEYDLLYTELTGAIALYLESHEL